MTREQVRELIAKVGWYKPVHLPSDWDEEDYVVSFEQATTAIQLAIREERMACLTAIRNQYMNGSKPLFLRDLENAILEREFT